MKKFVSILSLLSAPLAAGGQIGGGGGLGVAAEEITLSLSDFAKLRQDLHAEVTKKNDPAAKVRHVLVQETSEDGQPLILLRSSNGDLMIIRGQGDSPSQ